MTEGVIGNISKKVSRLFKKEIKEIKEPDKLTLGDGGIFKIRRGDVVYVGSEPEGTDLWRTSMGEKRRVIIEDPGINSRYLSRCALRLTISPKGYIVADKETGREGASGSNDVYVLYMKPKTKEWTEDRLIGMLPDKYWASYQESTGHPPIFDIITNDGNTVRLNLSGINSGDQGVSFVEYQIQINPKSEDRPIK